jgi:hypothetical protein
MSKKKLIIAGSLILTLYVLSSLMESDSSNSGGQQTRLTLKQPTSECPGMSDFIIHNPDATPEKMYEVEECNRELARRSGQDQPNTGFLGNTREIPEGALAHYKTDYGPNDFTVYEDRIVAGATSTDGKKTVIPFSHVTDIKEGWEMPSSVVIEYTSKRGSPFAYTFMMLRDDDAIKSEGARDIDRLIGLLKKLQLSVR